MHSLTAQIWRKTALHWPTEQISQKAIRSALLPSLDAFAYYGGSGLGGSQNSFNVCNPNIPASDQPFCNPAGSIPSTSYTDTLSQLVDSTAPDKGVGLTLTIPIRNRAAQSTQIRSSWNIANRKCASSSWKIRCVSKYVTPSSQSSKTWPAYSQPRQLSISPANRWMRSRRSINSGLPLPPWCSRTRRLWLNP